MKRPKLSNPYVLADQLVDLRTCLNLRETDKEVYKSTQIVIDWLESVKLTPDMHGGPSAGPIGGKP